LTSIYWQMLSLSDLNFLDQLHREQLTILIMKLVLLWAQLTKIYLPLRVSVQPISITKTLLIVPTKNERDPPLFTGKLLIKFQNILRNTTQVIWHRVKILFSVISSGHSRTAFANISMSNCFPSFIVHWILNFVGQPTHENHENWYPTNKSDFTVYTSTVNRWYCMRLHKYSGYRI
jgi:hypothetical protein